MPIDHSIIKDETFDEERALYNLQNTTVTDCDFSGPADGESALKESRNIEVTYSHFALRYPMWHVDTFKVTDCAFDETSRAPLWYSQKGYISNSLINGIKAVRECKDIELTDCRIKSDEFGWKSSDIRLLNLSIDSEYLFLDSKNIILSNVEMTGKYSFQYVEGLRIDNCNLSTKDAFWHSKNVTVSNSVIKGEYLGWYSENLTLNKCKIIGTQPLCYCRNLKLIDCTMENCDLAFEYSSVDADINGNIDSVKNPKSGLILADHIGKTIWDNPVMECTCKVGIKENKDK